MAFAIFLVVGILSFHAQPRFPQAPQALTRTALDGVYSEEQAARGQGVYTTECSRCHGSALEGISAPALTGDRFIERWREGELEIFYSFIKERMPLGRRADAKPIPDREYLDIVTYILKMNGYRSGAVDLTPNLLSSVIVVGKNGPQPVPDGSLVVIVGCLSLIRDDVWVLSSASEPARTRTSTSSTPDELRASAKKRLGTMTFRLADLEAVPDFVTDVHKGHKVQAKGYLVRQPNAERISVSSIEMLDSSCAQ